MVFVRDFIAGAYQGPSEFNLLLTAKEEAPEADGLFESRFSRLKELFHR